MKRQISPRRGQTSLRLVASALVLAALFLSLTLIPSLETSSTASAASALGAGTYQENNSNISYSGSWTLISDGSASGGAFEDTNASGAYALATVTGASSISWTSPGDPAAGVAQVLIDNAVVDTVDLYRSSRVYGITFGPYNVSATATHTFKLVNTGSKNASSTGTYVGVDTIVVKGSTSPTSTPPSATATPVPPAATPTPNPTQPPSTGRMRRVNAPYFSGSTVPYEQAGIFWLGKTSANTQYGDIRIGYSDTELYINANVMDRLLWYNENTPSPGNLTAYDGVSLFLSKSGTSSGAPDGNAYRFDAEMTWYQTDRTKWQAAYQGNGSGWNLVSSSFSTQNNWRGNQPNDTADDDGFTISYHIPWAALGLSGAPSQGTVWGLGVAFHNRNDAAGTAIADQVWPESMSNTKPTTWGQMRFGVMAGYSAPPASNLQTVSIKQNLNGQTATTTNVGGYTLCGTNLTSSSGNYWNDWGNQNWAGKEYLNVMNQNDPADWACYNKVYANFPLGLVPAGKVITSAKLTVYQFGHAGMGTQNPGPSLFQVFSTDTSWNPTTINWNNAPWPNQNGDRQWAGTGGCGSYVNCPTVTFDVSQMVSDAYKAGQPLRVILYDADSQISSGKYLFSSDTGDWNAANRPVLQVTYGN